MNLDQHSGFLLTYKQWIEIGTIVLLTFVITRITRVLVRRFINRSSEYLKIDKTRYNFFANALNGTIYILATLLIIHTIPALRSISTTLFASAGILAAVIGFASQQAVSNIISGVFVVIFRPFRVGDSIKVGNDLTGMVEDITLRHTIIKDAENARIVIPNSLINSQTVINYDIIDPKIKKRITVNLPYGNEIDLVIDLMQQHLFAHPCTLKTHYISPKDIQVDVAALTDKGVTLRAHVWTKNSDDAGRLSNDVNRLLLDDFTKHKVNIADSQTFILKNNE